MEPLIWKGFSYTPKPFTLDCLFGVYEITTQSLDNGNLEHRRLFKLACPTLLDGVDKDAKAQLSSGKLAQSVLDESMDVAEAFRFKQRVDFLYNSTYEQGEKLKTSAPDLAPLIEEAQTKSSQRSQKDMEQEVAHSG
jgi:hypothetical protein